MREGETRVKKKLFAAGAVVVLGMAIALAIIFYATQNDRFESELVDKAQSSSVMLIEPAQLNEWTHGFVACPYMPIEQIPQEFRSDFSESKLLNDGSHWLAFASSKGTVVEELSSSAVDFCSDNSGATFIPGQQWSVHKQTNGSFAFTLQQ